MQQYREDETRSEKELSPIRSSETFDNSLVSVVTQVTIDVADIGKPLFPVNFRLPTIMLHAFEALSYFATKPSRRHSAEPSYMPAYSCVIRCNAIQQDTTIPLKLTQL
jgi:hypothetical protein